MDQLTEAQRKRIQRNKEKAIILRNSKLTNHPYSKNNNAVVSVDKVTIKIGASTFKDTGGGFLLEEKPVEEEKVIIPESAPFFMPHEEPECLLCKKKFAQSWLYTKFECKGCDGCKNEEMFKLITKSEAMKEYLLKDIDLDKREPPLHYITRKNPHNVHWGEMKLYLQIQVEERALEVWGSEDKIQEELELREDKRIISKQNKYNKKMKELRMITRSSLYDQTSSASHTHEFGPETHIEEDTYKHTCATCGFDETFEKM